MHKWYLLTVLLAFQGLPAQAQQTGTLVVEVEGLSDSKGQVIAALYDGWNGFPFNQKAAKRLVTADINGQASRAVFKDIPYGNYAVIIAHDRDFSNTMKFKARFPAEGYGVSNNYDAGLAGISYGASVFSFSAPEDTIRIKARYGSAADRISFPADRLDRPRGKLNVRVEGLTNAKGNVLAALFPSEEGFPFESDKASLLTYGTIELGRSEFPIEDVPYGKYALVLFHDESVNGKLDMLPNGAPVEGYGVSGKHKFKFSPPSFRRTAFELKDPEMDMEIGLEYGNACSVIQFPPDREKNPRGLITARVSNIRSTGGWVMGALFPSKKGYPAGLKSASMLTYARPESGGAVLKFPDVPYGEYAVAVFHDANEDGRFNRFLGVIPTEPYGASNNAVRNFGPPKYKKAKFVLGQSEYQLNIRMK